jgi:hypothetical protein
VERLDCASLVGSDTSDDIRVIRVGSESVLSPLLDHLCARSQSRSAGAPLDAPKEVL